MACNCNEQGNTYHISMGCCTPIVANPNAYYTKSEIDEKLEDIVESGCCITPEEVDDKISAATSGYATEQWVLDKHYITGVDLSDYVTDAELSSYTYNKQEIDDMLDDMATMTWVLNKNYVTNSELIQYITNLQNQITSLQNAISGCCGGGGSAETIYRWVTMTGNNDYLCSGTTKHTKEKKQQSSDNGVTWSDVVPSETRMGNTVLEVNSTDCGYERCSLLSAYTSNGDVIIPDRYWQNEGRLTWYSTQQGNMATNSTAITSVTIADCITSIGDSAGHYVFGAQGGSPQNNDNLASIIIPSGVTRLYTHCIYLCPSLTSVTCLATTPPTMETNVFGGTPIANGTGVIYVPAESVNAYKTANRWSNFADRIQAIQ